MIPLGVLASSRIAPLGDAVFAHWSMSEGSGPVATDSVAGVTATLPASSRWVAGVDGAAVQVDPGNVLKSATISWPTHTWDQLVVEWRMRLDSGSGDAMVMEQGVLNDALGFWASAAAVRVWCYLGGPVVGNTSTTLATALGSWHQWRIAIAPATGMTLWRDGALIVHHAASGGYIGRSPSAITAAYIAGSPWGGPGQTVDDWKLIATTT